MAERRPTHGSGSPLDEVAGRIAAFYEPIQRVGEMHEESLAAWETELQRLDEEIRRTHSKIEEENEQYATRLQEERDALFEYLPFLNLLEQIREGLQGHKERTGGFEGARFLLEVPEDEQSMEAALDLLQLEHQVIKGKPVYDIAHSRVKVKVRIPLIIDDLWADAERLYDITIWEKQELTGRPLSASYEVFYKPS